MIAALIDDNLDRIKSDLSHRGLSYSPLMEDMLDHVCCMVEMEMEGGRDFDSSYRSVMSGVDERTLTDIQHQTLLNLDKKYQHMKNLTYIFGLTAAILTLIGAFFKTMHWPGASILITLGIMFIVLVFLPMYFVTSQREQVEKKNPVYAIVGYLTILLLLAGALFKIMHWPGAGLMIQVGLGALLIGFIPLYVVNTFQRGGSKKVWLPYIVMTLVGISIVVLMTSVRISKYAIGVYMDEIRQDELYLGDIEARTQAMLARVNDSAYLENKIQVEQIHDQAMLLQVKLENLRESLLESVGQPGADIEDVKAKDRRRKRMESGKDYDLEKEFIEEAMKFTDLLEQMFIDPVLRAQLDDHLAFTRKIWPYDYGEILIGGEPLVINYHNLARISKGIALSEFLSIEYLMTH